MAAKHSLSAYDANYLSLALENGRALATVDRRLAAAAIAEASRSWDRSPGREWVLRSPFFHREGVREGVGPPWGFAAAPPQRGGGGDVERHSHLPKWSISLSINRAISSISITMRTSAMPAQVQWGE